MMDNFIQILRRLPTSTGDPSTNSEFGGATPFKVKVKFDVPLFEGYTNTDTLEKMLSLLEGYFSIQKNSNNEKITFALLKAHPRVRDWWESYYEQHVGDVSAIFGPKPTFVDSLKEQYYHVGNYDDQYTTWTNLCQERNQTVLEYTNIFPTLCTKLGIRDSELHLVLKYCSGLHSYIQIDMEFLDISSLGDAYRYVVKIEQKFKKKNK
jgi:hypothetical protein